MVDFLSSQKFHFAEAFWTCTIFHAACVNAVRWSNSGVFLASAGDDKLVIIWQMSK